MDTDDSFIIMVMNSEADVAATTRNLHNKLHYVFCLWQRLRVPSKKRKVKGYLLDLRNVDVAMTTANLDYPHSTNWSHAVHLHFPISYYVT